MITGRSVTAKFGGHGVGGNNDTGGTIAQSAGHYVDSAFGVAHDFGYSTALYAQDPDMAMIRRSYDDRHGASTARPGATAATRSPPTSEAGAALSWCVT